jgi:nitrogen fixation protein NifU and related proteins
VNTELDALYQAAILDHHRHPRNFRAMPDARTAEGYNPLCGDRVTVYVRVENGMVSEATFQGFGCAIAMASASVMTEHVSGRTVDEADTAAAEFDRMLSASDDSHGPADSAFNAFEGVRRFPSRIKCAMLPWRALRAAVAGDAASVSTE